MTTAPAGQAMPVLELAEPPTPLAIDWAADSLTCIGPVLRVGLSAPVSKKRPTPEIAWDAPGQVDTGAGVCIICDKVAQELRLPVIGKLPEFACAITVHRGPPSPLLYRVEIHVPEFGYIWSGPAVGSRAFGEGFGGIRMFLGRNFLRRFLFIYDGGMGSCRMVLDPRARELPSDLGCD